MAKTSLKVIPCLKDNYSYLLSQASSKKCIIVDACEFSPIKAAIESNFLEPTALLLTHRHSDHIGGLAQIKDLYPSIKVFAHPALVEQIPQIDFGMNDGENRQIGGLNVVSIHTPCHTIVDISFYVEEKYLFSGDTLFIGGCGRFFEGTGEDMFQSLSKVVALPTDTKICCGHEYTKSNLEFAHSLEPNNLNIKQALDDCKNLLKNGKSTVPGTLKTELTTNPFLRWNDPNLLKIVEGNLETNRDPGKVISMLREMKNAF